MKVEGTFLRSRIARRTFLYFCAAALGPVLVLSLMAYRALDDSSRQARDREVVAAAKAYAFQVLERLDSASSVLEFLAANPSADGARSYGDPPPMFRQVRALPGPADVTRLQAGTRVVVRPVEGDLPAVTLVHVAVPAPDSAAPATAWMGELDRAFLWGPDEELEDGQSVCVRVQDGPMLHCGGGASAVDAGSEVPSGEWTLFLGGRFDTPSWVFTTSLPARGALEALPALLRKIGWIWLGTLLLVALLSLLVIRRTMLPLEELIEQTRRIPLGLKREHRARRNDEFGRLTTAFDEMGETVARQLGALRALSAVDEKILQGRPLGEVVHLVLDRIQHLFPDALVGVAILPSPEKKGGMYWRAAGRSARTLLPRNTGGPRTGSRPGGASLRRWPAKALPASGTPRCARWKGSRDSSQSASWMRSRRRTPRCTNSARWPGALRWRWPARSVRQGSSARPAAMR